MLPASYQWPAAVLLLAGGLLSCFLGYRIFRVVLGIYGFVLGALVATSVLAPVETSTTLLVALGGGLAGALLLVFAYFVGVALVGAALGAVVVHLVWGYVGGDPHPLVVIVACVLGALGSLSLQRYVIVVGTAFGGAWTLLVGALTLAGHEAAAAATRGEGWLTYPLSPAPGERWVQVAWIVLGVAGTIVQLGVTARAPASKKRKR
ncbi:MAG: DUF4203 domain-containing protein [Acidobacteria bacterium]|nr:DUF4203 domain-containing protein [Acidobacteriota bacterium]